VIPREKIERAVEENKFENRCSMVYKDVKECGIHLHNADVIKS